MASPRRRKLRKMLRLGLLRSQEAVEAVVEKVAPKEKKAPKADAPKEKKAPKADAPKADAPAAPAPKAAKKKAN